MKETVFTRLLWLSDIHFRGEYNEKPHEYKLNLDPFLNSFLELISEKHKIHNIKTVVLTGDLAFEGSKSDYEALDKKLIHPLKEILGNQASFIAIPGNHDVERKGVEAIFDNIRDQEKQLEEVFKDYKSKTKLLKDYERFYLKLFHNYSKYLRSANINSDIFKSDNRLFGYLTDHNSKIIYFLFNTAWFCLSASIKSIGIGEILSKIEELDETSKEEKDEIKNKIERFFKLYAYTNENGGQIIGSNLIKDGQDLIEEIDSLKYHEYTKITLLHHPFSWLSWEEMYSFKDGDKAFLRSIIKSSDLILTGHEHVPEYIVPSLIFERSWQIPAGMFLDDNIKSDKTVAENFPHNRFSLLDIYSDRTEEIRFLYKPDTNVWLCSDGKPLHFHRRYKYIFADDELLHNKIENFINNPNLIVDFFKEQKGIYLKETSPSKHDFSSPNFVIDVYDEEGCNNFWILVRPKVDSYYQKELASFDKNSSHHLDKKLVELVKNVDGRSIYIAFLSLDLLVAPEIYKSYDEIMPHLSNIFQYNRSHEEVREELFGKITQEADLHFDRYRHFFFSRSARLDLPFDKISNINFVNIVIPYWKFWE